MISFKVDLDVLRLIRLALICHYPEEVIKIFYSNPAQFSAILSKYAGYSLALDFLLNYGNLGTLLSHSNFLLLKGFGTGVPAELFTILQNYTMAGYMWKLANRAIIINDPLLDTLTGNQSLIFYSQLPLPVAKDTVVLTIDPVFGTSLHCSVGSTQNAVMAVLSRLRLS